MANLYMIVYLATVLEYLDVEILEVTGNAAHDNKNHHIVPCHLQLAVWYVSIPSPAYQYLYFIPEMMKSWANFSATLSSHKEVSFPTLTPLFYPQNQGRARRSLRFVSCVLHVLNWSLMKLFKWGWLDICLSVHVSKFLLVISIVSWKMAISTPSVLVLVCQVSWSLNSQVMQPMMTKNTGIVPHHLQLAVQYVSILLIYIFQT